MTMYRVSVQDFSIVCQSKSVPYWTQFLIEHGDMPTVTLITEQEAA